MTFRELARELSREAGMTDAQCAQADAAMDTLHPGQGDMVIPADELEGLRTMGRMQILAIALESPEVMAKKVQAFKERYNPTQN